MSNLARENAFGSCPHGKTSHSNQAKAFSFSNSFMTSKDISTPGSHPCNVMQQKSTLLVTKGSETPSCSHQISPIVSSRLASAGMWECGDRDKGFNPVANKLFWLVEFPAKAVPHTAFTLSYTNPRACVRKFIFEFYIKT